MIYSEVMTTSTIEHRAGSITITTTVRVPTSPTFPVPIPPLGEDFNTAEAVSNLYAVD